MSLMLLHQIASYPVEEFADMKLNEELEDHSAEPGQPPAPWLGDLYSTPGRLLAFFPDKERAESKWPEPGSCTRVTWATAPAHDYEVAPSSVQQVLGQCGLRRLPVPPVSAADSDSPPVDDFGALL